MPEADIQPPGEATGPDAHNPWECSARLGLVILVPANGDPGRQQARTDPHDGPGLRFWL